MSHRGSRGRRGGHEEEHENHERWLVTYADMLTLLMVLFIVMFAISQVDQKRFNALKDGLAAGFGQSVSVLQGSDAVMEQPGVSRCRTRSTTPSGCATSACTPTRRPRPTGSTRSVAGCSPPCARTACRTTSG